MKKTRQRIDFVSILINLILIGVIVVLALFVYYCVNYGVETTISEFADNLEITKISRLENTITLDTQNITNPIHLMNSSEETIATVSKNDYYYNQIDDNAKIIYKALESNIENLKTGNCKIEFGQTFNDLLNQENGTEILNSSYQQALDAFSLDKPEVFYLDVSKMLLMIYSRKTLIKTTYTVTIESEENSTYFIDEFQTKEQIDIAYQQLESIRKNLCNQLTGDTYNQIKQLHDCLIENLEYDQSISKPNIRNIYGALVTHEVVCEGYAKSFKYVLDELNIPNIIVVGNATNSNNETESHAWNYIYLNDKWYAVDVTWDDPIIVGGGKIPDNEKKKYFLKGSNTFNINHIPTGMVSENGRIFAYPELSEQDY